MATFDWPTTLVPRRIQILPPRATQGLSTSLNRFVQAVPAIRPPFTVSMDFAELTGGEVLAWRAFMALLEGRANTARLPLFDLWLSASDAAIGAGLVAHGDGTPFSDGALYSTTDIAGVTVTGVQGQRNITVDFGVYGQLLQAGQYFGLGDEPYICSGITWAGTVATIRCSPTLRKAYTAQPLRLKPTMIGRLTSDDGGALTLEQLRYGAPSIVFQEDFAELGA
ncbi:MAG: hypothetical protein KGR68_09460 [Betaproteobacteria bacterium]|nr:hypothetical protein [Betaproteobacteria bacterium]